jgi:ABC-type branched-subunit amino acid transport system substrate-binding protein
MLKRLVPRRVARGPRRPPPALAQDTIKIGEINSYKAQPAFLEPYKKGWELAVEEVNAAGGVLGKKLQVISRDDNGSPGDAVRVAEELVSREGVALIAGTFLSNTGLAVTDFAKQKKVFFLAAEPLTDKITWQNGNRYTVPAAPQHLHAVGDAGARGGQAAEEEVGRRLSRTTSTASRRRRPSRRC